MNHKFMLGCNYWASNAGTEMWRNWDPNAVESDFKKLSEYGVEYLRVFPNWRDFQPVHPLMRGGAQTADYRLHDALIPDNPYYLDKTMLERFGVMCNLAEKYGLKLIVGLLTGWMSGRSFVPPVLYGRKLATDPVALMFSQKLVHGMATLFRDKPSIYAWDLGNECNCLVGAETRDEAENWTMIIANAIRTADSSRPIVSGMHSLGTAGTWRIADQGAHTDILTTHPYPYWCNHCSEAEVTSVQTLMHATCETKYYSNLGSKPCLAEEIGTMGPMVCDDETSANFFKLNMYSGFVNGSLGAMWWCANEQIDLMFPPYDMNTCETELGMFDRYGEPKPVIKELKKFSDLLSKSELSLPKAEDDAVCLVTASQDQWGVAYSSYVFAKEAGYNIRFADATKTVPDAKLYLMPSIADTYVLPGENYNIIRERVKNGATLYISNDNAILPDFATLTGVRVRNSKTAHECDGFMLGGNEIKYSRDRYYMLTECGAEVLAKDKAGLPIFTKYRYGKGTVYYLNFPLEKNAIGVCDAFDFSQYRIYSEIFSCREGEYPLRTDNKYIGLTRHNAHDGVTVTMINYSDKPQKTNVKITDGYEYDVIMGNIDEIPPFEMTIVKLTK